MVKRLQVYIQYSASLGSRCDTRLYECGTEARARELAPPAPGIGRLTSLDEPDAPVTSANGCTKFRRERTNPRPITITADEDLRNIV